MKPTHEACLELFFGHTTPSPPYATAGLIVAVNAVNGACGSHGSRESHGVA
jgi:hypothetical protein